MSLSNLPAHLRVLLLFVGAAIAVIILGVYGRATMWARNTRASADLMQLEQRKAEFQELANELPARQEEFLGAVRDLLHLDTGLKPDEYVPSCLEQFRLWASQNRLSLTSFRPGDMIVPPPPPRKEATGEKPFEEEVGETLVGTLVGKESWAVFEKSKGKKGEPPEYDVLRVGARLTTKSGKEGILKRIGENDLEVEYNKTPYTVPVKKWETDSMRLEVMVEGGYEDFQRFLRSMNRFPKLINVAELSITAAAGAESGRLRFRLNTQFFFLPEEVEKTLAEAKAPIGGSVGAGVGAGGVSGGDLGNTQAVSAGAGSQGALPY